MSRYISCYDLDSEKLTLGHFEVPVSVGIYIQQLEAYIKHPEKSKLKEAYAFRFNKKVVTAIIAELYDRSGFDSWWDSLEVDTKREIETELLRIVKEYRE